MPLHQLSGAMGASLWNISRKGNKGGWYGGWWVVGVYFWRLLTESVGLLAGLSPHHQTPALLELHADCTSPAPHSAQRLSVGAAAARWETGGSQQHRGKTNTNQLLTLVCEAGLVHRGWGHLSLLLSASVPCGLWARADCSLPSCDSGETLCRSGWGCLTGCHLSRLVLLWWLDWFFSL